MRSDRPAHVQRHTGSRATHQRQRGMSLVELMVGILVGLLVVMAASGSLAFFEAQRTTSLTGNAAMNSGMMGGYLLQRDLRNAGVGLFNTSQLSCTRLNLYFNGATRADGSAVAPVQIVDGGAGSDSISVFFADSVLGSAPLNMTRGITTAGENLHVSSSSGVQAGDVILIAGNAATDPCSVAQVTSIVAGATDVDLVRAGSGSWNPASPSAAFTNAPLYSAGGVVMRTGNNITWRNYSAAGGSLTARDQVTNTSVQVATNVLTLQAQYGVTDGISNIVRRWVDATNEWANPTPDLVTRIRAVRFSVIVRSARKEIIKDAANDCSTTTVAPAPWADVAPLDLSGDPDWKCYRYQVYASIVPLKNVVWSVSQ
jgi:type IV pilus assembly protein PilW